MTLSRTAIKLPDMMPRCRWWLVGAGLLVGVVLGWSYARWTDPSPGSLEDVFLHIQVGMSQRQTVTVLETLNDLDSMYYRGITKDGQPFSACCSWAGLPSPEDIKCAEVEVCDNSGRSFFVYLGRGGIVIGKRFDCQPSWDDWLGWIRRVCVR